MPEQNTLADPPANPTPPAADPPPADPAPPAADPPAADPPAADPPADAEDHGSDAEKRIRGLLAENKALREYGSHWRDMALVDRPPARGADPPPAEVKPDVAPKLADYDSTQAWADAHTAWSERQIDKRAAAAVETTLQTRERTAREETTRTTYTERLAEYEKTNPNARLIIANPTMTTALRAQPAITEVVMASEVGPALAVHLSNNPAELVRISRLPAAQAAAALGRIEGQLAAQKPAAAPRPGGAPPAPPKPATRQASNAPPPPTPIDGGGTPSVNDMDLPLDDFLAKINRGKKVQRR